jgi:hypothetical protein
MPHDKFCGYRQHQMSERVPTSGLPKTGAVGAAGMIGGSGGANSGSSNSSAYINTNPNRFKHTDACIHTAAGRAHVCTRYTHACECARLDTLTHFHVCVCVCACVLVCVCACVCVCVCVVCVPLSLLVGRRWVAAPLLVPRGPPALARILAQ